MRRISDYLLELSDHHNKVSISGLGTFHFEHVSAQVSGFTDWSPPGLKITFSSDFQADLSVFTNYVAAQEQMDIDKAEHFIQILVNGMLEELQSSGKLELDAVGTIQMDDSGNIAFKGGAGRITNSDSFGLGKISSELIQKEQFNPTQQDVNDEPVQQNIDVNDQKGKVIQSDNKKSSVEDLKRNREAEQKLKKKKLMFRIRLVLIIVLSLSLLGIGLAYTVYMCHEEPEQIGIDLCSKAEFLIPLGKQVYQLIK